MILTARCGKARKVVSEMGGIKMVDSVNKLDLTIYQRSSNLKVGKAAVVLFSVDF